MTVRATRPPPIGTGLLLPLRTDGRDSPGGTRETTYYVLGGAHVGIAIGQQLRNAGHRVVVVDESYEPSDIPGVNGDPTDVDVLGDAGVEAASTVIVAAETDRRNLLIAQLVRARFDVSRIVVLVREPERVSLFTDAGHESFCVTTALAEAYGETV